MFQTNSFRFLVFSLLVFSSCAKTQYINSAQITTHVSNGDEFASLVTNINSAQLALPALSLPIIDLKNPSISYGSLSISPSLDGKSTDLTIDVDLTVALKLPVTGQGVTLPNGTSLPISGIDVAQTMEFSLGGGGSKVYLEVDPVNKKAFVGTALVIPQLQIGATADLFIPFSSNNIAGTAGLFTGTAASTSGLGVFADLSSVLASTGKTMLMQRVSAIATPVQPHQFLELNPTSRNQLKIQSMMMRLSSERARLEVR